jgi:hypothetical protein
MPNNTGQDTLKYLVFMLPLLETKTMIFLLQSEKSLHLKIWLPHIT